MGKDDVPKGKPHLQYAVVAQKLGVAPAHCVVFEDAILGEQAAYRARMPCVAVATTLKAKDFQDPLTVIRDFTELTPARLHELFEAAGPVPKPSQELARR